MTNTLQALQSIDDGDFEELAIFFIRRRYPEFAGLKATGVNEEGRSIACPVDAIAYIPGSPPSCVALAATTTKYKDLKPKWVGGKNKTGDIEKAVNKEFRKWKEDDPTISFTLFLAVNQLLKSNTNLYRESIAFGNQHGVNLIIIEASELIDFLDNDSDGVYIREKILGIKANRLSEKLLKNIAEISLQKHQSTFSKERTKEIIRESRSNVLETVEKSNASLIGLRGSSGVGKSTLLRQVGRSLNADNNIAIWIPHNLIEVSSSIEELVSKSLQRFHPSLGEHEGFKAFQIVASLSCKLVLLIDDINRSPNPIKLLKSLESIVRNQKTDFVKFIVPLWPGQLSARPEEGSNRQEQQDSFAWEEIGIDVFSPIEKKELIQSLGQDSSDKAYSIIESLHGDPFLCGIALENKDMSFEFSELNLIEKIFSQFLLEVGESSRELAPTFSAHDFIEVVDKLIEVVLMENDPEPTLEKVCTKLSREELLRHVASRNKIGWIDNANGVDFWHWKHDKIRSALIGRWLANEVLININQEDFPEQNEPLLSNLGLSEAWAFSLAFIKTKRIRDAAIDLLAKYQPLVLAESLQLKLFPESSEVYRLVAKHLKEILLKATERIPYPQDISQQLIYEKLSQTDNSAILFVTEQVSGDYYIWAARLRNGDVTAALEWIDAEVCQGHFTPGTQYDVFELALERFLKFFSTLKNEHIEKILVAMGNPQKSVAAMILAGYLTWPELAEPVWCIWKSLSVKQKLIATVPAIWALSRCGDFRAKQWLEEALNFNSEVIRSANGLHEQDEQGGIPQGIDFFWRIDCKLWHPGSRWPITSLAAEIWVKVIKENPEIHRYFWDKIRYIDEPLTVGAYVQYTSDKTAEDGEDIQISMIWRGELSEGFHDPIKQIGFPKKAYKNPETINKLWNIIDSDLDPLSRLMAFLLWKPLASIKDLEKLRNVSSDDELLSDEIAKVRFKLRDKTSSMLLIDKLKSEPRYWCAYVPFLQDDESVFKVFLDTFEAALEIPEQESSHHRLNSVAKYLSTERIKELVRRKHELLINSPQTWLALWCTDVPEALGLVQKAMLQKEPGNWELYFCPNESFHDQISSRMLNALTPIFQKHLFVSYKVTEWAADAGLCEWVCDNAPHVATEERIRLSCPTVEDINRSLSIVFGKGDKAEKPIQLSPELQSVRSAFRRRNQLSITINLQSILEDWMKLDMDEQKLLLAAKIIAAWGDSRDISWWENLQPRQSSSRLAWENTLQVLKRRKWYEVGEFVAMV